MLPEDLSSAWRIHGSSARPGGPRPSMKADISNLHKQDILILQRQTPVQFLCPEQEKGYDS
jgi:hypothetical protein